jgi:Penicillinase repressor
LPRKVKIEFQDESGTKYSLAVEGRLSREKVIKIVDLMDLMEASPEVTEPTPDNSTSFGRVLQIIQSSYLAKEFSSSDIARDYEENHGEPIGLSTISTYLSRLASRGYLKRQKFGNSWVYRMVHIRQDQAALR